ncbi:MAG: hypothetical protein LBP53_05020 [Candidatus Peribacteria bacterium]|nr:hypothetical protein [Candidatus Peribacteria bacterium]
MKKTTLFHHFKQWCVKMSVSSVIFVSVVILGGAIITWALPSSLDEVTSQAEPANQLTAEKRNYLVAQVKLHNLVIGSGLERADNHLLTIIDLLHNRDESQQTILAMNEEMITLLRTNNELLAMLSEKLEGGGNG